jgi:predicted amidohydrolase
MQRGAVPAPYDLPFAWNRIEAEAEPDAEMMLVADVPLEALREARARGTVQNLNDRRTDL